MRNRFGILILITLLSPCVAFFFVAVRDARESARRTECLGHLCQLNLAMHCYHETYGTLPPAYVTDENGKPIHSWRILILPFIDANDLYEQYHFDEPWNGPNNRKLASKMPNIYRCPSYFPDDIKQFHTNYVVVSGKQTAFPGPRGVSLDDITDDKSKTIIITETCNAHIHWMEPRDLNFDAMVLEINSKTDEGVSSMHDELANNIRVSGDYHSPLMVKMSKEMIRALFTINGDESVDDY